MEGLERHLAHQLEHGRDFFWHRLRWAAVSQYFPAERFTLVDVGAGIGLIGEFLRDRHPEASYRFVEPIPFLEEHLEQRYGANANARNDALYDGVSVVTLLDVLEHQEDDHAFMSELVGRLEPGAILVVTVPAGRRLWSEWDVALGHHRRYDKPSFRRAVGGLPVEIVELHYLFPELVPLAIVRKVAMRRPRGDDEVEFPELPRPANELLYRIGSASLRLRRAWPLGTSLLAVLRRSEN
jgi:SAM-dependent methyltransferase